MSKAATALAAAYNKHSVWREGDRIRATDGGGYADGVSDSQVASYAYDDEAPEYERAFAKAVLAIREFERTERPPS